MTMGEDGRILPWHEEKLQGVTLVYQSWKPADPQNDHDHCAFCWAKFAAYSGCLHGGYSTLDRHDWICESCFNDLKAHFQWRVKPCIFVP